jgi:peptidoglycan/LPS O-acetylase OafA/YrhL
MGLLRLFLATIVAMSHLESTVLQAHALRLPGWFYFGFNGGYAVMVFYMISGFLISMVLASKYKDGTGAFYFKRGVRIFSLYLPIALVAFLFFDSTLRDFQAADLAQKITSIGLIGSDWLLVWQGPSNEHSWLALPNPLHQAWTLSAELTFYLAAPWLLRSNIASATTLLASAAIRASLAHHVADSDRWLYFFLPSTFMFFLMGHWARLLAERFRLLQDARVALALLAVSFGSMTNHHLWELAMACFALSLPGLFKATKDNVVLNWLGALSYPIYLVHNMVWMTAFGRFNLGVYVPQFQISAMWTTLIYLLLVLTAAVLAHYLLEQPCAWLLSRARLLLLKANKPGSSPANGAMATRPWRVTSER